MPIEPPRHDQSRVLRRGNTGPVATRRHANRQWRVLTVINFSCLFLSRFESREFRGFPDASHKICGRHVAQDLDESPHFSAIADQNAQRKSSSSIAQEAHRPSVSVRQ